MTTPTYKGSVRDSDNLGPSFEYESPLSIVISDSPEIKMSVAIPEIDYNAKYS